MQKSKDQSTQKTDTPRIHTWLNEHIIKVVIGLIITTLSSMAISFANLYIASRTASFAESDRAFQREVQAISDRVSDIEPDHEKVIILEQSIPVIKEDIQDIKSDVKEIKNLLNQL